MQLSEPCRAFEELERATLRHRLQCIAAASVATDNFFRSKRGESVDGGWDMYPVLEKRTWLFFGPLSITLH